MSPSFAAQYQTIFESETERLDKFNSYLRVKYNCRSLKKTGVLPITDEDKIEIATNGYFKSFNVFFEHANLLDYLKAPGLSSNLKPETSNPFDAIILSDVLHYLQPYIHLVFRHFGVNFLHSCHNVE